MQFYISVLKLRVTGIASNNPNFYRRSLLPNKKTFFTCNVTASYVKPTAIRSISILNPYFINMDTLGFTVKWLPPIFGNGQLQSFEIRVLSEEKLNESSILMQLILDVRNIYDFMEICSLSAYLKTAITGGN